jgi:hypothetical protein
MIYDFKTYATDPKLTTWVQETLDVPNFLDLTKSFLSQ